MLVHGGASTWQEWGPLLPLLTPEREVIALRSPGHWNTAPLPDGWPLTVPAFADLLERELDELGLGRVDLVGHSFGGWHVLELARRGRASRVVAIAPTGGWSQEDAAETERLFAEVFIPGARAVRPFVEQMSATPEGQEQLWGVVGSKGRRLSTEDALACVTSLAEWPLAERLHEWLADGDGRYRSAEGMSEVECPVALMWGSEDPVVPVRQARYFLERLPDAGLTELPGLGHFPQFDDPETIARVILEG